MKNYDVINLVNAGILAITANDLDAAQSYKVLKFKKAVRKSLTDITESERELLEEAGIENPAAFDKERGELRESGSNPERLAELDKTFARFSELRSSLYNEDAQLEGVKTIPFAAFHDLQRENKDVNNKPLNFFDDLLEGVLWAAPQEEE